MNGTTLMNIEIIEFPPCTNDFDTTYETIIHEHASATLESHGKKVDIIVHIGNKLGLNIESITLKDEHTTNT